MSEQVQSDGTVRFHISVRVDMGEFSSWKPDRIAAFFGGIAQVLAVTEPQRIIRTEPDPPTKGAE